MSFVHFDLLDKIVCYIPNSYLDRRPYRPDNAERAIRVRFFGATEVKGKRRLARTMSQMRNRLAI